MKLLLTIKEQDFNPEVPIRDAAGFEEREAARAVVFDEQGRVALLKVGSFDYHKLPGGGIDPGEDIQQALARELLEEIGCEAQITGDLGQIVEYRDWENLKQTSYCFVAKKVGEQKNLAFTESELSNKFERVWASSLDEAVKILEADEPKNHEGKFIRLRDLTFLNAAKQWKPK